MGNHFRLRVLYLWTVWWWYNEWYNESVKEMRVKSYGCLNKEEGVKEIRSAVS